MENQNINFIIISLTHISYKRKKKWGDSKNKFIIASGYLLNSDVKCVSNNFISFIFILFMYVKMVIFVSRNIEVRFYVSVRMLVLM